MNVTANQKLVFTSKCSFQKTCVDCLKSLGTETNVGIKTELVNIRNNAAAMTATNIPNKRNI